jgi:hypothetical protein
MINTRQQIGCAIGTALLSTIAAGATSGNLDAAATVHGYTTAFWCSAGIFAGGALLALAMFPRASRHNRHAADPAFAH